MIRPVQFTYNAQTAVNNAFQKKGEESGTQELALAEFDAFVTLLRHNGVRVSVVNDTPLPHTPDSIFPNNWISFHNGTICLYPMYALNRRLERKATVMEAIQQWYHTSKTVDLSKYEQEHLFLEGTGSMVLDRENKKAYACLSPRTNEALLQQFCETLGYQPVVFHATDLTGHEIYHTNVMMCVADKYVVICADTITNPEERERVLETIRRSGKDIVTISMDQMQHFAGNMLQIKNEDNEKLLIMSTQAWQSLSPLQKKQLEDYNRVLHTPLDVIETNGGGSARCMLAEVY
ncbi:amidinotransferase [Filimonas effusa]|uniref:Amidinotransferase n=2 Tax=Filimonas effusa TaxID=2508721 RepID=A0A4Q1DCZ7_9BACT|nr:amidinotransferase [Filimonas effusa]